MKVFRFMSESEFKKYKSGNKLLNNKDHNKIDSRKTNSKGFCFLDIQEYSPEEAMHFLSGIVSFEVCALFETNKELIKSYGVYATPIKRTGNIQEDLINLILNYRLSFTANEYCTTEYSEKDFKLLKFSKNLWEQWNPLDEQERLKWEECSNELQATERVKTKNGNGNTSI